MAKAKKVTDVTSDADNIVSFTDELIKALNKEHGDGGKVAYNLLKDDAPTKVHRWISTGCRQLDYIIANRPNGGLPEGRIIEIFGPPGLGKSHIAAQIAKNTQQMGGIVCYIDSENASSPENLQLLGVNIGERFIYCEATCTENVFALAESVILKTRSLKKDVPVTIIWDSVAATSPKAEILGDYDKDSIGLQARALSKGFRKITQVVGSNRVTFVCCNQTRTAIGVMYGDNQVPSGGKSIPFHASVRIKLGAGKPIENAKGETVGIKEHEELFDVLRPLDPTRIVMKGRELEASVDGTGGWKTFVVTDPSTGEVIVEKKFTKQKFEEVLEDPEYKPYLDALIETHMVRKMTEQAHVEIDDDSYVEMKSIAGDVEDILGDVSPEVA